MTGRYYRLSAWFAASVSLALAGCDGLPSVLRPAPMPSPPATPSAATPPGAPKTAANTQGQIDTDATIWTVLGLAKERKVDVAGPTVGAQVSPILWQAAHDTLDFVKIASEDPMTGRIVTDWYAPADKPNERFRTAVFILARTLRSDSVAVRVERQARAESGEWQDTGVDRKVDDDLVFTILNRAREIRQILAEAKK